MKEKKRIGIKYCGGCNPSYERVKMIQQLESLLKDRFIFSRHNQQDFDILVLVNGCPRACADKTFTLSGIPFRSIVEESGLKSLMAWVSVFDEKGEI
jgi:hypothetical protein